MVSAPLVEIEGIEAASAVARCLVPTAEFKAIVDGFEWDFCQPPGHEEPDGRGPQYEPVRRRYERVRTRCGSPPK
jgi:hypothetical protein